MTTLTERQRLILALIIHTYVETAQPVGSKALIERYKLDTSSATIRNDMVELTDAGYLRQPYTSAGRVPTEEGYRYFVRQLMGQTELPMNTTADDHPPVLPGWAGCEPVDATGGIGTGTPITRCFAGDIPKTRISTV